MWKALGKSLLAGIAAAFAGLVFADLFSVLMSGLDRDTGRILGMGTYLVLVIVVCTGLVLGKWNRSDRK